MSLSLRAVYLEHLEVWGGEVRSEEEREAKEKEGEAHGELELRLHLHRPRQTRITQDIQRVRAGEVVLSPRNEVSCLFWPQRSWRLTETELVVTPELW